MSKNNKSVLTCNICGAPYSFFYQGEYMTITSCEHYGVHPSLWNKHKDYDKFQMLKAKQHKKTGVK